jgi:glycosyltransferase involved in cell wall biosynthesis
MFLRRFCKPRKETALVFFPHNLFPPQSGAHVRCLSMLRGLRNCGLDVHLASSTATRVFPWRPEARKRLLETGLSGVHLHASVPSALPPRWALHLRALRRVQGLLAEPERTVETPHPLYDHVAGLEIWFARLAQSLRARVVVVSYAGYGYMRPRPTPGSLLAMDTYDLVTLNSAMQAALSRAFGDRWEIREQDLPEVLNEGFYDRLGPKALPAEFAVYDLFDCAIAITDRERDAISAETHNTRCRVVRPAVAVPPVASDYSAGAVFATGPNLFNFQGALYYAHRVAPLIRQELPSFELSVTGDVVCRRLPECAGLRKLGFVPNLEALYSTARFAVCPVFGGTGQQFKIIEAMAHGLPVVALKAIRNDSAIVHGVNGFLCADAEEFARCCVLLTRDVETARRMGQEARKTVENRFTQVQVDEDIRELVADSRMPCRREH